MFYSAIIINLQRLGIYRFISTLYWCVFLAPNITNNSPGNPIIGIRLSGRGCSASILFPSSHSAPNTGHPSPQSLLPVSHLRPLSADPSPLIIAKFISRDRRSLKGKADWTQLSSPDIFSPRPLVETGSYLSPHSHWLAFQQTAAV